MPPVTKQGPPPGVTPMNPPQPKGGPPIPDVPKPHECELAPCKEVATRQQPVGYPNEDGTVSVANVWMCDGHDAFLYHELPDRARSPHVLDHSHFSTERLRGETGGTGMARTKTAEKEGFQVLDDNNLLDGVEARIRQLEAERHTYEGFLAESKAIGDEDGTKQHGDTLDTTNKRLAVQYKRRDDLLKGIAQADRDAEKAAKASAATDEA